MSAADPYVLEVFSQQIAALANERLRENKANERRDPQVYRALERPDTDGSSTTSLLDRMARERRGYEACVRLVIGSLLTTNEGRRA